MGRERTMTNTNTSNDGKGTILITGGSGFLGPRVCSALMNSGYDVVALSRPNSTKAKNIPHGVKILEVDFVNTGEEDEDKMIEMLKSLNLYAVVHMAAEMDFYPKDPSYLHKVNVDGTRRLVHWTVAAQIPRFIYVSSTEAIGSRASKCILDETSELKPSYEYGKTKVFAEDFVKRITNGTKTSYTILRPTCLYGPGDGFAAYELFTMASQGFFFFLPGKGDSVLMVTHVDDVAHGILCTVQDSRSKAKNNTYIICSDDPLTVGEMLSVIGPALGRTPPLFSFPLFLVKFVTMILALFMNIGKQKIFMFHPSTIECMQEYRWYSNAKAKQELGYSPKYTTTEGLLETIKLELETGSLKKYPLSPFFVVTLVLLFCLWYLFKFLKYCF
eukprot:TRINITY_DN1549_c0_g2_i1.p1 TRINITY_DN1549_c0_g2~~TRINITY_DN1549_c0_g2_i1.p1  ORF type:complete len:387 (-),score=51.27 TRINITY_DN1549_c0_g2_i1:141-1301(-)